MKAYWPGAKLYEVGLGIVIHAKSLFEVIETFEILNFQQKVSLIQKLK